MDDKLYIPMGIKPESEIFTGFGKKQLFEAMTGSLCGGGIAFFIWLVSRNLPVTVITVLASIIGSVMMTVKDQNNLSVVDQVRFMFRFTRGQKYYPYRYGDEWGIGL